MRLTPRQSRSANLCQLRDWGLAIDKLNPFEGVERLSEASDTYLDCLVSHLQLLYGGPSLEFLKVCRAAMIDE